MTRRNAGDYVKRWGAALIRGAATNAEFSAHLFYFFYSSTWFLTFLTILGATQVLRNTMGVGVVSAFPEKSL